ncbi:MAG: hypothetical protein ABIH71_00385, partial [Candidatus Omnitrophota bacterium]
MKKLLFLVLSLLMILSIYAGNKTRAKITGYRTSRSGKGVLYYVNFNKNGELVNNDSYYYEFLPDETKQQFKLRVKEDLKEKAAAYDENKKTCDEVG